MIYEPFYSQVRPALQLPSELATFAAADDLDQVVDAYLEIGIRPFVELGFMPSALASGDATVFWWHGNITPPSPISAPFAMIAVG